MKFIFCFLSTLLFVLHLSNAQTTPEVPAKSNSNTTYTSLINTSSTTKIRMRDDNQKLNIRMKDGGFSLDLDFEKGNDGTISDQLTEYFGKPVIKSRYNKEWTAKNLSYHIRLKNNHLDMSVNKGKYSKSEWENFIAFTTEMLEKIGCNVSLNM